MTRTRMALFCLALATGMACADEGDDNAQVVSNAAAAPLPFESNTNLELLTLDSAACYTDSTALVPGFAVYQDPPSFKAAYLAARPRASQVPVVDFGSYVVVGAVLGQQGGCGAKLDLIGAVNRDEQVEVELRTSTSTDCTTPADTSFAFAFAQVNRLEKPYVPVETSDASSNASCVTGVLVP